MVDGSATKSKKIEEDYTMYEEAKDDELEDIMEEEIEEESDLEDRDPNEMGGEREERKEKKEELKMLKTQMVTIKERLVLKTMRIEEIKETLKKSQLMTKNLKEGGTLPPDQDFIDEVKELEN